MDEYLATLIYDSLYIYGLRCCELVNISGDTTREETHVPIPNTTVKLTRPMIVQNSAKVGCCRVFGGSQKCESLFF